LRMQQLPLLQRCVARKQQQQQQQQQHTEQQQRRIVLRPLLPEVPGGLRTGCRKVRPYNI
jgi:hypothetical protein